MIKYRQYSQPAAPSPGFSAAPRPGMAAVLADNASSSGGPGIAPDGNMIVPYAGGSVDRNSDRPECHRPESVGYAGENTVAAIPAARTRMINLVKPGAGRASPAKLFEENIALKLQEMGLIEDFRVNPISEQRQEYEVKVRTKGSMEWVDLPDIGFGVSQVLPVLVQCFYAPPGSIILMEQPEIHLHPNAQSVSADLDGILLEDGILDGIR